MVEQESYLDVGRVISWIRMKKGWAEAALEVGVEEKEEEEAEEFLCFLFPKVFTIDRQGCRWHSGLLASLMPRDVNHE